MRKRFLSSDVLTQFANPGPSIQTEANKWTRSSKGLSACAIFAKDISQPPREWVLREATVRSDIRNSVMLGGALSIPGLAQNGAGMLRAGAETRKRHSGRICRTCKAPSAEILFLPELIQISKIG